MTLSQLEYALAVERHLSFRKAAEASHITQPSLSTQIQKLEEELGVTLFDRSRTPVTVTEVGRSLLKQARLVIDEAARMKEIVDESKNVVRGEFRLGVIPTIAPYLLPLFLDRFTSKYPDVRLIIEEDKTSNLIPKLDAGQLDAALLSTPKEAPESLMERFLFYEPFVVYAGDQSPLAKQKCLSFSDLAPQDAVLLDDTHCMRDQVEQICRARKKPGSLAAVDFQSGSLQTLMNVVDRGPGYTFLPQLAAARLTEGSVKRHVREFEKPVPTRKISFVFHRAHLKRSIMEALRAEILAALPDTVYRESRVGLKVLDPHADKFEN